ncbi:MAG: c-type cytochrome domain-containing protein [Planctomycetaceae bacterium]
MAAAGKTAIAFMLLATVGRADDADPRGVELKPTSGPILVQHCYECHSGESKKIEAGLRVDSRAGLIKGGESGPAIVSEKPAESLLLRALRGDEYTMPPDGLLPADVVADFEKWIAMMPDLAARRTHRTPPRRRSTSPPAGSSGRFARCPPSASSRCTPTPSGVAQTLTASSAKSRSRPDLSPVPTPTVAFSYDAFFDLIGLLVAGRPGRFPRR